MDKRKTILIVDDVEMNRSLLADILSPSYNIIEAATGIEAIAILSRRISEISLMLLDILMPEMDGIEVLSTINGNQWINSLPVIMLSSESTQPYIEKAYRLGATDYITRPFDEMTVCHRVQNAIALHVKQKALEDMVTEHIYEREQNNAQLVEVLSNIVEFRNGESGLHVLRIRTITDVLLHHIRAKTNKYNLTAKKISLISNASAMHDIGKICISTAILNKDGKLTPEEYDIIKTHSMAGAKILEQVPSFEGSELLHCAYDICRWHHERYDGRGYPDGLKGEAIPISAQAVALADVYDSLISERSYKPMYSHEKAMRMIADGECGVFSPLMIECLLESGDDIIKNIEIRSASSIAANEMSHTLTEVLERQDFSISGRTIALLEQEREKTRFFSSMSKEILVEYDCNDDLLEVSEWGARYLSIPELISKPEVNPALPDWGKTIMSDLREKLKNFKYGNPDINQRYSIPYNDTVHWFKAVVRPLWDNSDSNTFSRVIGKLTDINEEVSAVNELKELSEHDTLTVLYNRRAAEKMIECLLTNYSGHSYAVVLIDVDYFKTVNDTYGHGFGDKVLQRIATNIQKSIQKDDIAARIGGDEFLVLMDCGGSPIAAASRLFRDISDFDDDCGVTVSMGVSVCPQNGLTYRDLIRCADIALYSAKNAGKNSFRFYDQNLPDFPTSFTPFDGGEVSEKSEDDGNTNST